MNAVSFRALADGECPTLGLFFLDDPRRFRANERIRRERNSVDARTKGMAFLASPCGLVATCAHVLTALDLVPGNQTTLFCAAKGMPFLVDAEVEVQGWLGPDWRRNRGRPESPAFAGRPDLRPDVVREDLAFLRLIPGSERLHMLADLTDAVPARSDGADRLVHPRLRKFYEDLRVLPLGAPGYPEPGAELRCWAIDWNFAAPTEPIEAPARFEKSVPAAHHLVTFKSEAVRPGYSGSPLWDEARRLVVGMVRGERFYAEEAERAATDARALLVRPEVRLSVDSVLRAVRSRAMERTDQVVPPRHGSLTAWADPSIYVETRLGVPVLNRTVADAPAPSMPALAALREALARERKLVVLGAAGMGKSMLAVRLAASLSEPDAAIDGVPVVPLLITAAELVADSFSFDKMLVRLAGQSGQVLPERDRAVWNALVFNGAKLVLLVDGIDEVSDENAQKTFQLLGDRQHLAKGGADLVAGILLFTRPMPNIKIDETGRLQGSGRCVLELLPCDAGERDQLIGLLCPDPARAQAFHALLAGASWSTAASPLQIRMAALLFDDTEGRLAELPKRPLDLPASTLDLLIRRGCRALNRADSADRICAIVELLGSLAMRTEGEVSLAAAREAIAGDADVGTARETNPAGAANAILNELSPLAQVVVVRGEDTIAWMHRSFPEAAAAKREIARRPSDQALVNRICAEMATGHHMTLVLLAAAERACRFVAVRQCLQRSIEQPMAAIRPHLLAVRALAAGIDADGAARRAQLKLLLQMVVSEQQESMSCMHVFSSEGLPDPLEILERPELREDVLAAFQERIARRLDRSGRSRPAKLLSREVDLLRRLDMLVMFSNESPDSPLAQRRPAAEASAVTHATGIPIVEIDTGFGQPPITIAGEVLIDVARELNARTKGVMHSRDLLSTTIRIILSTKDIDRQ